ncbi:IS30 family transposase [Microbulbifer variabilis]|uniref:IS30 family transposase n=1 Tax=Microbulbifer variabilis TaxID=266805 RepID=UPI001CFCBA23|nr:IS30 family transposase [Microbulbifer variabilis]
MTNSYRQLTEEQRCQIWALKKSEWSQRAIAREIGVSQPTICRELARNRGRKGYRYKQAQRMTEERCRQARRPTKMLPKTIALIESKLKLQWSPEQVSGWLDLEEGLSISHETIYLHIWADMQRGGTLYENLRRRDRPYNKRANGKSTRGHIKNAISIEQRPQVVDDKSRIGDWEIDTVIGKGHSGALVTIVDRKSKFTLSQQVERKTAELVAQATIALLEPYRHLVHTITADNGKEFALHEKISEALDAQVYFAHPYSSWERGLNENTNGLLRQYFPKKTDFKLINQADVRAAIERLNNRPRKTLGYKTSRQIMGEYTAAIAA